ncbi:MAG: site-specific integrase [Clostridium chrysemydis]|uniref:site-specific integrase n=1 Tax=Clostridium TaxID=1485 RepID=UPI002152C631|nr:site-specific integrase [Clostridium sp. LY3-2]MCR6514494.1 site-specific integrase [Clostridium sp. LY3-2]
MKFVQPIRDRDQIEEMKSELLKTGFRNYLLFTMGINTGLRVSDILNLKVSDVRNKSHITIREKKTSKHKRFYINSNLKNDLDKYIYKMNDFEFLFSSQKGGGPITRIQAYRILRKAASVVGIDEVGTHTMRKTFGYFHYNQFKDIAILQDIFNHSAPSITLRYIGITDDMKDKTIENFYL